MTARLLMRFSGLTVLVLAGLSGLLAAEPRTEDVAFVAHLDRSTQRYVLITPADFNPVAEHGLMVALHGHGSDRWQFVRDPRDECRSARDVAARHGMLFVSPDYRARTSWMGPAAESDLLQILDDLKRRDRYAFLMSLDSPDSVADWVTGTLRFSCPRISPPGLAAVCTFT